MNLTIANFHKYDELLASGAQPTADQLSELKEYGCEVIVNISPVSARNSLKEEAQIAEKLKMEYIHFPVDCSNLRPLHYKAFCGILNGLEGKRVFVHCGANIKSSNLIHMYHVLERKKPEAESLQTLLKIQNPEEKWFSYFKQMGMQGIR